MKWMRSHTDWMWGLRRLHFFPRGVRIPGLPQICGKFGRESPKSKKVFLGLQVAPDLPQICGNLPDLGVKIEGSLAVLFPAVKNFLSLQ
jgi:hypothetical protein